MKKTEYVAPMTEQILVSTELPLATSAGGSSITDDKKEWDPNTDPNPSRRGTIWDED